MKKKQERLSELQRLILFTINLNYNDFLFKLAASETRKFVNEQKAKGKTYKTFGQVHDAMRRAGKSKISLPQAYVQNTDLSKRLRVNKGSLSRSIKNLKQKGFIEEKKIGGQQQYTLMPRGCVIALEISEELAPFIDVYDQHAHYDGRFKIL